MLGCVGLYLLTGCTAGTAPEYYRSLASNLHSAGHLRIERAPADAPYDAETLSRNFHTIAFFYEFRVENGSVVPEQTEKPLNRWSDRIRYRLAGDGVTAADRREIAQLADQFGDLTGLEFEPVASEHDLLITIAGPRGRRAISDSLKSAGLPAFQEQYDIWRNTPGWICGATLGVDPDNPSVLTAAHIFMASELNGTLRRACLHEEFAQALGLTNDSPRARPSVFNDDQEFALITTHDALLLQILYDPRLTPGMTATEAMPTVNQIIAGLLRSG